jgi:NlpC/P60 family putative phage cell wall peptidase
LADVRSDKQQFKIQPMSLLEDAKFRQEIASAARSWLGTPYKHQASVKGQGCDCLGLVRGIWREIIGEEPLGRPTYSADWDQSNGDDLLLDALNTYFHGSDISPTGIGDVVGFRLRENGLVKHVGIIVDSASGFDEMIHSYSNHGVVLGPLGASWLRRCAGQFKFPRRVD